MRSQPIALLSLCVLVLCAARADAATIALPFSGVAFGSATSAPDDPLSTGPFLFDYTFESNLTGSGTRSEVAFFGPNNTLFGTQVWVAENGDELFVDFISNITSPTSATGVYTFTGGTGEFAGSFGEAEFIGVFPTFSDVTVTFQGTLFVVPEPSTGAALATAMGGVALSGRRRARGRVSR